MAVLCRLPVWSADFSVGIAEIDAQHQKLFALGTRVEQAVDGGVAGRGLLGVFDELTAYAAEHFALEEARMTAAAYPELKDHLAEHARFTRKIAYFRRSLSLGKSDVAHEVLEFLGGWLARHVREVDSRYGPCLRGEREG